MALKGGCTGSSESTLVKIPHFWKSRVTAQIGLIKTTLVVMTISAFQYHLEVYTGKESKVGTDANVSMQLFGQRGDTGLRRLLSSKTNSDKFEQGQVSCDLERIHIVIIFGN